MESVGVREDLGEHPESRQRRQTEPDNPFSSGHVPVHVRQGQEGLRNQEARRR